MTSRLPLNSSDPPGNLHRQGPPVLLPILRISCYTDLRNPLTVAIHTVLEEQQEPAGDFLETKRLRVSLS